MTEQTPKHESKGALVLSDIQLPAPAVERGIEADQWNALKMAIWPGASDAMILTAMDYCRARHLDPFKKPVHIVTTWDAKNRREVETLWEGIPSLRITASRTGEYLGQDEPEFGPMVDKDFGKIKLSYPEWCKITVYRKVRNRKAAFTAIVYWQEAFATKQGGEPNRMWAKRPRGQLVKCTEAEALRKAFPEEMGGEPSAEEMDGQIIDAEAEEAPALVDPDGDKVSALEAAVVPDAEPEPWENGEIEDAGKTMEAEAVEAETPTGPEFIAIQNVNGSPDWSDWCAKGAEAIKAAPTSEWLEAWIEMHDTTIASLKSIGENGEKWADRLRELADERLDYLNNPPTEELHPLEAG